MIGVAHCIVPKKDLIVEPVHTTTPLSVEMLADDGQLSKSSTEIVAPASSTEPKVPSTTPTMPTPTHSTTSTATATEASAPPMTVAEVIFRRNDTELAKSETIEINSLPLPSNATETSDNATISIGNDVEVAGIGNDTMQSPDTSDTPEASETFEAFEAFELMPDVEEVAEPSEVYATTAVPEMTSADTTSTLENSTVLTVPVSSTTSTPPTIHSTTIAEILLDKIEEISEAPEQNYVYEVMTLPQVISPTDDRAQNIVLDKEPPENLPNDTAVAA